MHDAVVFTKNDIDLFAQVSHDYNPLHCDFDYARKTSYGEQVVHGILGLIACLGTLIKFKKDVVITSVDVQFLMPLFCEVAYIISGKIIDDTLVEMIINDGETKLLRVKIYLSEEMHSFQIWQEHTDINFDYINMEANDEGGESFVKGSTYEGIYAHDTNRLSEFLMRFNIVNYPIEHIVVLLMWSSYSVGMIIPGKQALFSRLKLDIKDYKWRAPPLRYKLTIEKIDSRFNSLHVSFVCFANDEGNEIAEGTLTSFIRQKIKPIDSNVLLEFASSEYRKKIQGKTVLITGASRGLGAILAKLLSAMKCNVIVNFQYSLEDAKQLQKEIQNNGGYIELWQGDISNIEWLSKKKVELLAYGKTIDILICNACQSPQVLLLNQNTITRINNYIVKNVECTSIPLSLFLPLISENHGSVIIISSAFVEDPKPEFPQYISCKAAIEGMATSIAKQYRNIKWIIARPKKMLTDMSNSPLGNQNLSDPVVIAKSICTRLLTDDAFNPLNNVDILSLQ